MSGSPAMDRQWSRFLGRIRNCSIILNTRAGHMSGPDSVYHLIIDQMSSFQPRQGRLAIN